jgi:F-type H+-transporting ATPase subunit a
MIKRVFLALSLVVAVGASLSAQEHAPEPAKTKGPAEILLPHLTDSKNIEYPCWESLEEWGCHYRLPSWYVHVPGFKEPIDFGPTKHTVWLFIAAVVVATGMLLVASSHKRHSHASGHPKGFAAGIEAVILYLRNEIYIPVLGGHGGEKYVPFCLTLFFFIVTCNFFGMVPYGATPTGNLAVTAGLALITFIMIEIAGMRALGKGYIGTIIYFPPKDMNIVLKIFLMLLMSLIEIISKFTKPFALTVRLFANMIAGHVIILSLIGLIFLFGGLVALGAIPMALFISVLELLVIVVQAFIFSLLAAVFIGQIRVAHH